MRARSHSNLNTIGIALRTHDEIIGELPPARTVDKNGDPLYGWHVSLLPFVEQGPLYDSFDKSKPWNDPVNQPHSQRVIQYYRHQHDQGKDANGYGITTYAANIHAIGGDKPRTLADFGNGTSNVLLVGEISANYKPWASSFNVRDPKLGLKKSPDGFGGPWKNATQFLMADGSVRAFSNDTDPEFLKALADPAGR